MSISTSITSNHTAGNICTWNLNTSLTPYDEFDPQLLEETTVGHQNAIWDLVVHPTQDLLISAGADGVCKLWKPFNVAEFIMGEDGSELVRCCVWNSLTVCYHVNGTASPYATM